MVVPIAGKELRQDLSTIMTPEAARKGITSLDIQMFISIISMLLMMNVNHGIKKHVLYVDYITIHLLSVGREWQHEKG